jgi:uncharacterized cupin superfamily protein
MRRFNFRRPELRVEGDEAAGYDSGYALIDTEIGGEHLAGNLAELEPGQHSSPYHWEAGREEWLFVLTGRPSVRTPEGERELRSGDIVCFPRGPEGAHKVTNRSDEPARIIIVSDRTTPNAVVYPDSDKIAVKISPTERSQMFRRETSVDYWDRES